jgi:hypothetical protein
MTTLGCSLRSIPDLLVGKVLLIDLEKGADKDMGYSVAGAGGGDTEAEGEERDSGSFRSKWVILT